MEILNSEERFRIRQLLTNRLAWSIFAIALASRLFFLIFMSGGLENTGWYWDAYHHWQISYFTQKIGIYNGPRMWDLGGMEYFWGILPSLVQAGLMALFNTTSIIPFRVATIVFGSISVSLIYLLCKRYFNQKTAISAALILAVNPVLIVGDASGMQEPLAIMLLLLAVWYYDKSEFKSGLLLALASMCRAEYWILSMGMLALYLVFERNITRFVPATGGWLLGMIPYMFHLRFQTGNPIYPVYWNLVGNIAGQWLGPAVWTSHRIFIKNLFMGLFFIVIASLILTVWKKPRFYALFSLFLGNLIFLSYVLGFSPYTAGYIDRVLVDRLFALAYMFLAVLIAIAIGYAIPKKRPKFSSFHLDKAAISAALILFFLLWPVIMSYYRPLGELQAYDDLAVFMVNNYNGGRILVPGDQPQFVYRLVQRGITAYDLLSLKYHPENQTATLQWLFQSNITMAAIPDYDRFWIAMAGNYTDHFIAIRPGGLAVYRIMGP